MNAVAYCIDQNYLEPLEVSLFSLLSCSSRPIEVHAVSNDLTEAQKNRLTRLVALFNGSKIFFHQPIRRNLENIPIHLHFSIANFDRIYLPEILSHFNQPILYIDADTIFRADVNEIFTLFSSEFPLAACQDYLGTIFNPATRIENPQRFGFEPNNRYFNSGLLMINSSIWRERELSRQLAHFCSANPETLFLADQSAMNIVFRNQVQFFPPEWNVQTVHPNILTKVWDLPFIPQNHSQAKMIHFTTELKPWNTGKDLPEAKFYFETKEKLNRVNL